mgnify:CR=1 FL=1
MKVYTYFAAIGLFVLSGCAGFPGKETTAIDVSRATEVSLWATRFYAYDAHAIPAGGVPLRDMKNRVIGPNLSEKDWRNGAIEGTILVDEKTYNYAGTRSPRQARRSHKPSRNVRWTVSPFPYGAGSNDNPLQPYRTLACDFGTVRNSTPWLNGGYARFGQQIYIPAAVGTKLPDGTVHDGLFTCGDIGGLITGNHVDVFIGAARGEADAAKRDPFGFVGSTPNVSFQAYVLP